MKFLAGFILAMAVIANAEAVAQPYVVPIYRVIRDPAATTTTTTTTTSTTLSTSGLKVSTAPPVNPKFANLLEATHNRKIRSVVAGKPYMRGVEGFIFEHVCSGTLVDNNAVITTISCYESATRDTAVLPCVGTAADTTSVDSADKTFYEVRKAFTHPEYNADTNVNNVAVLKLDGDVDYSQAAVQHITWSLEIPKVDTSCVTSYWQASDPNTQVNQVVTVKACDPVAVGSICSTMNAPPAECPSGSNGGSLVCGSKVAGLFAPTRNADCSVALWEYQELSKDALWIWESVNAAPILNVSFAAILVLVTALLKNL